MLTVESNGFFNLGKFCLDPWIVYVTLGMESCECFQTIFLVAMIYQPTGRFGEK